MGTKRKRVTLQLAPDVQERLQAAAARKGVSLGQYCRAAIYDALSKDEAEETAEPQKPHFDIESLIALRNQTFGDRVLPTDSTEMIREAREERTRHLDSL